LSVKKMNVKCKFYKKGNLYYCEVTSANITRRRLVKSFNGEHKPGKSNQDVKALVMTDLKVHHLPVGIYKIFRD
jgi:hypothetical protein